MKMNLKDRKTLTLGLCLILVCVFTLTVAYSALSAVLTINGNARVSSANWDIYLNNPRVTQGSATTNVPQIKTSSTLEFETTLNMPGDFYEFVVDVVNGGDIDAMIENVVKTPNLTAEQAKFLKYEITYQNNEPITTKQLLAKDTTMPIKVRVEYRKDLSNADLPTNQVVLDLSLTLEYIQSDGTGNSVNNNGVQVVSANGDINEIGTIVTIGTEQFYTIGTEGENVKLLSMYNLSVGSRCRNGQCDGLSGMETGMQSSNMKGYLNLADSIAYGVTAFSSDSQKGTNYNDYEGSIVEEYVNNYKTILEEDYGVNVVEARLLSVDELHSDTFGCVGGLSTVGSCLDSSYDWIYSTSYWTGTPESDMYIWFVRSDGCLGFLGEYHNDSYFGVRPVIVISKNYFN